jgi:hypothetical protein
MGEVDWSELVVGDDEFAELRAKVEASKHPFRINWLSHETLDRLYLMIFPDGTLTIPSGPEFLNYGPFLDIDDIHATLERTDFDAPKHARHSTGWGRKPSD